MESFYSVYSLWTLQRALVLCGVGTVLFVCLGITLLVLNDTHVECKLNYEEYSLGDGGTRYECLPITAEVCGPAENITALEGEEIYVYYELENFNQNGGQIVWNRSDKQLAGHIFTDPDDVKDCEPFATRVVDNVTKVLHPCGSLAWHVFNDNFLFFDAPPDGPVSQSSVKPLPMRQSKEDILLRDRWEGLYKNPSAQEREAARDKVYFWMSVYDNDDGRKSIGKPEEGLAWAIHESLNFGEAGMMVENSHFIQWMEPAALPSFRKLYGKLNGPLRLPLYAYISINYDVKPWGGKKAVVLVVPSALHGRTLYLGIAYLVFGCMLLLFLIYLVWRLRVERDDNSQGDIWWRAMLTRHKRKSK
ncbi:cell cycle control protein 50A [Cyclospora cayetanensis]|uniref:Cell cycle control protein 50A n=1 Tax=Cyclospora cayetanensis TaxID=88456 RepID=A0A6P5WFJ7_9EIME|nr:cell cycle control protein 50A [Cyclospora cayetanensis]